ncbi:hypothetical protein Agub_g7788 [Astrephomene gubernaculifera]|uniref:Uncharacterized protein n=1 Tax=Astrephomene gubernaculifera TaxID=47775 RepID=A0AAD3DTB1_9CHLO|nr:hypothetical protein Agub_g7788 [Astrephomene gubernaculifera]
MWRLATNGIMYPTTKLVVTALLLFIVAADAAARKAPPPPPLLPPQRPAFAASNGLRYFYPPPPPNLCFNHTDIHCPRTGPVEVLVYGPKAKQSYWAPLCEPADAGIKESLADLICKLVTGLTPYCDTSNSSTASCYYFATIEPYTIPKGNPKNATYFNPNSYNRWVTVTGGNFSTASSVQDLNLKVSATKCSDGKMLAMYCAVTYEFRDRLCNDGVRRYC